MNKVIEYEVSYDLQVEIKYIGEEEPNEHYFELHRHFPELTFDDEEDEAKRQSIHDRCLAITSTMRH